jgi:hypothetical protein
MKTVFNVVVAWGLCWIAEGCWACGGGIEKGLCGLGRLGGWLAFRSYSKLNNKAFGLAGHHKYGPFGE